MTHQSFMLLLVVCRNVIILHKMQNNLKNFLIDIKLKDFIVSKNVRV